MLLTALCRRGRLWGAGSSPGARPELKKIDVSLNRPENYFSSGFLRFPTSSAGACVHEVEPFGFSIKRPVQKLFSEFSLGFHY
jgi:hypothetical protein